MIRIEKIKAEQTWEIRHQVMWPAKPKEYVQLAEDFNGSHFGLFVDERLTSIVSVFEENGDVQFRKFATLNDQQGKGYGSQLLQFLFDRMERRNCQRIWCNARQDKVGYYRRFGLSETDQQFTKGGIAYVIMEKRF